MGMPFKPGECRLGEPGRVTQWCYTASSCTRWQDMSQFSRGTSVLKGKSVHVQYLSYQRGPFTHAPSGSTILGVCERELLTRGVANSM